MDEFEKWYAENAFDFEANPIGSRECGLQRAAWQAGREAGLREAAIDADAATRYGKTAQAHGFSNAPPWSELADETKQLYRDAILSAIGGGK